MFFKSSYQIQDHKSVLEFIVNVVDIRFESSVRYTLQKLIIKYREKLIENHDAALDELKSICKNETKHIIEMMSLEYFQSNILYYFSEEGIIEVVYTLLLNQCRDYITRKIDDMKVKTI